MLSWCMARVYDRLMQDAEVKCLNQWRADLLKGLNQKEILELGCGTGANLNHYPKGIQSLILVEPDRNMRVQLMKKMAVYSDLNLTVWDKDKDLGACQDQSLDAVVVTLVLCTVPDPKQILENIYRVLRPGGQLLFIEHVLAKNALGRQKWQKVLEPIWKRLACGCHLTRDTLFDIQLAGFKIQSIKKQSIRGVPPVVRPSIRGIAIKPSGKSCP